jgi:hypothetical protein
MIGIGETILVGKGLKKVFGGGERPGYAGMSKEEIARKERNKRVRRVGSVALGAGILVGSGVMGIQAFNRALERNPAVTNEITAQPGEAEIIKFQKDYEAHCWTASTIQVTGTSVKDEMRVLGVSTGWKETKVDAQIENKLCIDGTALDIAVNSQTGHVDINLPSKDSIRTDTSIVLGTLQPHVDQTPSYVVSNNFTEMLNATPWLEDFDFAKDLAKVKDGQENGQLNVALVLASKAASDKCRAETWDMAKPAVEAGIEKLVSVGMEVVKAKHVDVNPNDISVLVESKPISELKVNGDKSNIDEAYEKLKKFDADNENFSISSGKADNTCKVSDDVKPKNDISKNMTAANSQGKGNE